MELWESFGSGEKKEVILNEPHYIFTWLFIQRYTVSTKQQYLDAQY